MSFIGVFVSFWIIFLSIYNYLLKFSYSTLSSFLGHVGLGLFIMGASISISSQEDFESSVRVNSSINIGGYDIDFKGVEDTKGPNYISSKGIFVVNDNDNTSILNPEKRFYPAERSVTTEAAIMTNFLSHIYIVLGEKVGGEEWVIRIWYKPFISLIWIGALFAALGGLFALLNRKKLSNNVFKIVSFFIISIAIPMSTNAKTFENEIFDNATEKRIHSINQNIRCMVCESQTIDDSNSPLAKDLRSIVRDKVLNGETDIEIYDFFRKRYGDYVILKPPFRLNTFILWFTPIFIFIFGFLMIYLNQRGAKDLEGNNDP
jgi:cytochrome c-type biogenesis protein CcmF